MAFSSSFLARMVLLMAVAGIVFGVKDLKEPQYNFEHVVGKPCKVDFSSVDYSAVTKVCKAPDYSEKECCEAFNEVACKYAKHVNNYATSCPVEFVSFLNLVGEYPMGVFVGRCNKPGDYRLCSISN